MRPNAVVRFANISKSNYHRKGKLGSPGGPNCLTLCFMKTKLFLIALISLSLLGFAHAQSGTTSPSGAITGSRATTTTTTLGPTSSNGVPYTEGGVWTITFVKTKAGLDDDYLRQISGTVKPTYEEMKKQKIILDYKVLSGDAAGRDDFNVMIMVEYPNMAALDGLREKTDPVLAKVMGSEDQRRDMAVKRLDIRDILGTKTMREITLK
jgi:hypothetical protein